MCHSRSVEPVRKRWDPLVHVEVRVERELRRALGEPPAWASVHDRVARLTHLAEHLRRHLGTINGDDVERTMTSLTVELVALGRQLSLIAESLEAGDPESARTYSDQIAASALVPRDVYRLGARLRSQHHPASLPVAAAVIEIQRARKALLVREETVRGQDDCRER